MMKSNQDQLVLDSVLSESRREGLRYEVSPHTSERTRYDIHSPQEAWASSHCVIHVVLHAPNVADDAKSLVSSTSNSMAIEK